MCATFTGQLERVFVKDASERETEREREGGRQRARRPRPRRALIGYVNKV